MFPHLTPSQQARVAAEINQFQSKALLAEEPAELNQTSASLPA
jgi:hypothetical protein